MLNTPYAGLTPDVVLAAVESIGVVADGRLLALNSYENRVYRVGLEDANPVVAKFYRHGRWSDAQIHEEHDFAAELAAEELPVVPPLFFDGESLHRHAGFRFSLFECRAGHGAEIDQPGHRALLGRTLARMHAVGRRHPFRHRDSLAQWRHGARARDLILDRNLVPAPLDESYARISGQLVQAVAASQERVGGLAQLRIHGDCHGGNILWQAQGPLFVDFDDCLGGPAVQDLWMFCAGEPEQIQREWTELLEGYEQFGHFDFSETSLVEALRAMRMLNHAAWIASRWTDPAFPRAFPWFGEPRYWERHIDELREQLDALEDPPLLRLAR
ncbi:MAG: serine/threonine protein kinase [Pseudomonadota bacterium]